MRRSSTTIKRAPVSTSAAPSVWLFALQRSLLFLQLKREYEKSPSAAFKAISQHLGLTSGFKRHLANELSLNLQTRLQG